VVINNNGLPIFTHEFYDFFVSQASA
jgi:hypothetical protein